MSFASVFSALFAVLLLVSAPVHAEDDPFLMMQQAAKNAFSRIDTEVTGEGKERIAQLEKIAEEELMPYVYNTYAAYYVIGPQVRKIKPPQRDAFVVAFSGYMRSTMAQLLRQYKAGKQQVIFDRSSASSSGKVTSVYTRMVESGKPDIALVFKLRFDKKADSWRVFDVIAEGISVLQSKRKELEPLIKRQGIDAVTADLERKVAEGIDLKEELESVEQQGKVDA